MRFNERTTSETASLLRRLKQQLPHVSKRAKVVGSWIWIEFSVPPDPETRSSLRALGFHWNGKRRCWQNPCVSPSSGFREAEQAEFPLGRALVREPDHLKREASLITPKEFKVICLRECPLPESMLLCDTPEKTAQYWQLHIATNPYYNPDIECFAVIILNTRYRVKGHQLVSLGTLDTLLVHPREVFRGALIAGAAKIVLAHNHPSGEPEPSEADIRVTRDLIRAGQILRIEVVDHVVIGNRRHRSLRELGFFYA